MGAQPASPWSLPGDDVTTVVGDPLDLAAEVVVGVVVVGEVASSGFLEGVWTFGMEPLGTELLVDDVTVGAKLEDWFDMAEVG